MPSPTAPEMIRALGLKPHPEGVAVRLPPQFSFCWRAASVHWHRIDAVEVWHYYAGAPLKLEVVDGSKEEIFRLGADINAGEAPQVTVPARAWQAAESLGPWTLTGCTVAPEFIRRI